MYRVFNKSMKISEILAYGGFYWKSWLVPFSNTSECSHVLLFKLNKYTYQSKTLFNFLKHWRCVSVLLLRPTFDIILYKLWRINQDVELITLINLHVCVCESLGCMGIVVIFDSDEWLIASNVVPWLSISFLSSLYL